MPKQTQSFHNSTDAPFFLNLELSTARFRLDPGKELVLHYDTEGRPQDSHGSPLRVELIQGADGAELVIWTYEHQMFHPDGRVAARDYGRSGGPLSL